MPDTELDVNQTIEMALKLKGENVLQNLVDREGKTKKRDLGLGPECLTFLGWGKASK